MLKNKKYVFLLAPLLVLLSWFLPIASPVEAAVKPLFEDLPAEAGVAYQDARDPGAPPSVRTRRARTNLDRLESMQPRIRLNLFKDLSLTAVSKQIERRSASRYTWFGHIRGSKHSRAIIAVENGKIAGHVTHKGKLYHIYTDNGGETGISEVDQSAFPQELEAIPIITENDFQNAAIAASDGGTIDVMILYTPAVAAASANISAQAQLAVDVTNTSYANSGITQRLRLVHSDKVTYTESGNLSTDLTRLRNKSDGYIDQVHTLRDQYGADLVSLWVESANACGIGYTMTSVSSGFSSYAFTVVKRSCAVGNYSQTHEWGHNMGAKHDRYVSPENGAYDYSHGFVSVPGRWRTIMAYNNECSDYGVNCTRLPYWSNPNVIYGGRPMGIAENKIDSADNRLCLENTASTIANFKQSISVSPPQADFTTSTTSGFAPLAVTFTNTSSGTYTGFVWDFGDGKKDSSTVQPTHTYSTPGTYVVTLTVTGPDGTSQTSTNITASAKPALPTVSITAYDAWASERGNTGAFRVSRTGSTSSPLTVYYSVSGTATNGVDYKKLSGYGTFPAGYSSGLIRVTPIDDKWAEKTETVIIKLQSTTSYTVDPTKNTATVYIVD